MWTLLLVGGLALAQSGCRNACQDLCDSMGNIYKRCGKSYTHEELSECRATYSGVSQQELEQCESQTEEVIQKNLELKSGSDDACAALEEYGP